MKRNYMFILYKDRKQVKRIETMSLRRFLHKTRLINFLEPRLRVYLRISYGKHKDVRKNITTFFNDGYYENKNDFLNALNAFIE